MVKIGFLIFWGFFLGCVSLGFTLMFVFFLIRLYSDWDYKRNKKYHSKEKNVS